MTRPAASRDAPDRQPGPRPPASRGGPAWRALCLAALAGGPAAAGGLDLSGFGTLGYARSDQSYAYQRSIDDGGTFERDSVLGLQLDARDGPWGATFQARLAPSDHADGEWEPTLSWAFLSWRPTDDWLLRAGKLRVPLYLNSENMDVGATFDFARLPTEMYSLAPTTDFTGLSFTRTWAQDWGELSLDGYGGRAHAHWRYFFREDLSPYGGRPRGPSFLPIDIDSAGLVLTAQAAEHRLRAGVHRSRIYSRDDLPFVGEVGLGNISWIPNLPVEGYLPVSLVGSLDGLVLTLGADLALGNGVRAVAEVARRTFDHSDGAPDTTGGYLALLKEAGPWTPYVSVARLVSSSDSRRLYRAINGHVITAAEVAAMGPAAPATAALFTATQRHFADALPVYDQTTFAVGASYRLSPTQRLKAEWARTRVGEVSSLVDAPPGSGTGDRDIDVLSLSYSFVF